MKERRKVLSERKEKRAVTWTWVNEKEERCE